MGCPFCCCRSISFLPTISSLFFGPASAFGISVTRGLVVSGGLILTLPALWGGSAIWLAMPLTELVVALAVAGLMVRSVRQLKGEL